MERKAFLAAAAGTAATLGAVSARPAQAALDPASNRNMRFMIQILNAVVNDLNQDAHDYGGYRVKAIDSVQAAISNINSGLEWSNTH